MSAESRRVAQRGGVRREITRLVQHEQLTGRTFPQRKFADDAEAAATLDALTALGIPTSDKEGAGYLHAELFVSWQGDHRSPLAAIAQRPKVPAKSW